MTTEPPPRETDVERDEAEALTREPDDTYVGRRAADSDGEAETDDDGDSGAERRARRE